MNSKGQSELAIFAVPLAIIITIIIIAVYAPNTFGMVGNGLFQICKGFTNGLGQHYPICN